MPTSPILMVTTQPWLQAARLALRFKRYGAEVKAVCPRGSQLAYADSVSASYPFSTRNPFASLRSAIDKSRPDFIVPTDDRAVWFLHELSCRHPRYKELIERSIGPATSYPITRSRARLLSLAVGLGIAVPPTCSINHASDLEACVDTLKFPFFIKKDGTWAGSGVRLVADRREAFLHYQRLLKYPRLSDRLIQRINVNDPTAFARLSHIGAAEISAQAHIDGVPATAMFACHEGTVLGGVQARVISAKGKHGAALMIELMDDDRITQAGVLLARELSLSGFFGLDYILEAESGTPYLIELNPRCTQFGHIAVANQPDLAAMLWARITKNPMPGSGDPDLGSLISFFPQAVQYDPASPFLSQSRFDVCLEDLADITRLGKPRRSWSSWVYGKVHQQAKRIRASLRPSPASTIFYFNGFGEKKPSMPTFQPAPARARKVQH